MLEALKMKTEIDWKLVAMRIFSAPKVAGQTTPSRPAFDLEQYTAWRLEQAKNGFTQPPGEWIDPPYQFDGDIRIAGGTITGAVTAVTGDGLLYDGEKWRNIGPVNTPNIITGPRPGPDTGTHA